MNDRSYCLHQYSCVLATMTINAAHGTECRLDYNRYCDDDSLADPYNFLIFEVVESHVVPKPKYLQRCSK